MEIHPPRKVAIIVETFNRFGSEILSAIGKYVYEHPHWQTTHLDFVTETSPPPWLANWRGDGIILRDKLGLAYPQAVKTGAKVVDLSIYRYPGRPTVHMDEYLNIKLCIDCFRERFLEHFAYVGIQNLQFSDWRTNVFQKMVGNAGYVFQIRSGLPMPKLPRSETTHLQNWLLQLPKPIGVIGCYDPVGLKILEICERVGIKVPEEMAVVGINNDESYCRLAKPPLSSVTLDGFRIGYAACELLESLMNGRQPPEKPLEVPPLGLVNRRSTDVLALEDRQLIRAIQFLRQNACLGIGIDDVAAYARMHRRVLERRFQKVLKRTPLEELHRVRLQTAGELLKTTPLTVEQIATKIGFQSVPYFYRAFQKFYGMTPRAYRKALP
ncbi:MAG: DNA-binding transcriptional regulator [Planctomycetia bacterium]|nr:DNA-binding transcriptional regulator [Planctomycetia bacterium]